MALETELATYRAKLGELLPNNEGKFVLIHRAEVVGAYGTYEDAIKEGYEKFKLDPFLVKQISAIEEVQFITRFIDPCHT